MGKNITGRSRALRVERLIETIKDLEECAIEFPETRGKTLELLECYQYGSRESSRLIKRATDKVAAVSMLEILHGS